jgi:nucleoid DNA-binding protein
MPTRKAQSFGYVALGRVIAEVLECPIEEGTRLARAVFQSITAALQRGEEVYVRGFGIFRPHTRKYNVKNLRISATEAAKTETFHAPVALVVEKTRILFLPSTQLRAMLNYDSPNYVERKAIKVWNKP